ncbi:TRAP transporter fused permease subunit [Brevibacterium sp.]|uniref:TRAP transporter permease n=1 Tax=Brevibacterium sp. TaxID=1701 RepID=UPI0025C17A5C|nr:TRAP transporter fused permease subunit [Brevibacterium sp.]
MSRPGLKDASQDHGAELLPDAFRENAQVSAEDEDQEDSTQPLWQRLAEQRVGTGGLQRAMGWIILALALALGGFQLYIGITFDMDARQQRLVHLLLVLTLIFLTVPAAKSAWGRSVPLLALDALLVLAAVAATVYPIVNAAELARRAGAYETTDWVLGIVLIVLLLEATRRTVGWFMSVLVLAFMFYAWAGPWFPGAFNHRGATIERLSAYVYLGNDGILGMTLGVVVTFVFIFVLFGALLQKTGGGNFCIGLAFVLTGRYPGGPAKGAVVGSAMMGSISGTALGNVATTGPFTIPMMKKVGYNKEEAAGVEAAASTGGQILPPIMGAGAFLIAERTGIPYAEIVLVSIIPALMYFGTVYLFVDIKARKRGMSSIPKDQLPVFKEVMKGGWHFLAPLVLLIVLLLQYVPPGRAGLYATAALFVVAMLRSMSRLSLRDIGEVFVIAARNTLPVSAACAIAGIIVGVVGLTGLGLVISDVLVSAFAGSLLLTLIMVALASLILGVGLPVTASYVVLIILAGPALQELGLAVIVTHLIVYWFSQDSNVTPPVALAAFVAAGIANSSPMRSAFHAWIFAKGLYFIPLMFAYSALLLTGTPWEVTVATVTGCVALVGAAVAIEGYLLRPAGVWQRIVLAVAALLALVAPEWTGWTESLFGVTVASDVFLWVGTLVILAFVVWQVLAQRISPVVVTPMEEREGAEPEEARRAAAEAAASPQPEPGTGSATAGREDERGS